MKLLINPQTRKLVPASIAKATVLIAVGLIQGIAVAPTSAQSEDNPMRDTALAKKHQISLGAAWQKADAIIFADSQSGASPSIELNDLAIDDSDSTFYAEYRYRFKERWALALGAYTFSATGGRTLERDISFGDFDFSTGSVTESKLEVDAYLADILYRAYDSRSFTVWVGGGIHSLDLGATIRGDASINDNEASFEVVDESLLAPVPNFRGVVTWTLNPKVALLLKAGWLSANVDNYSGDFIYAHLRAVYAINNRFNVSFGYQFTEIDVVEARERGDLGYDVSLGGPTLTLGYGF